MRPTLHVDKRLHWLRARQPGNLLLGFARCSCRGRFATLLARIGSLSGLRTSVISSFTRRRPRKSSASALGTSHSCASASNFDLRSSALRSSTTMFAALATVLEAEHGRTWQTVLGVMTPPSISHVTQIRAPPAKLYQVSHTYFHLRERGFENVYWLRTQTNHSNTKLSAPYRRTQP